MKCDLVYIYALILNNKPIYIGKTMDIKTRYRQHKNAFNNNSRHLLYQELRKIILDFNLITIKVLKITNTYESDLYEMKYIKYCINKKQDIFNNCSKTIHYKLSHREFISHKK